MNLHKAQQEIVRDKHRFKVLRAGRRFGKTILAVEQMVYKAITTNDGRIVYVAPTFQAARDIAFDILKNRAREMRPEINETRLEVTLSNKYGTKSKILLRSWDSIETLRGQFFDLIILDEIAHIKNFWINWQEVLRPTLTDRKGKVLFISTPLGFNHFYDLCNEELKDKEFKTFHFTSYDNPHLPVDELEAAKNSLPDDRFHQEYLADFQKTEGLVFKEFMRDRHLYDELPYRDPLWQNEYKTYGAIDFGFRNPAAVLTIKFDNEETIYVEDEWYKTGRTDVQIAEYVKACKFESVFPDPENPGGIEELRRAGVNAREVQKGKGSVQAGIQRMREMFIRGKLMVNKRCINLISELETYSYKDSEEEKNHDERPEKAHDHAIDALRYAITSLMPLVIQHERLDNLRLIQRADKPKINQAR